MTEIKCREWWCEHLGTDGVCTKSCVTFNGECEDFEYFLGAARGAAYCEDYWIVVKNMDSDKIMRRLAHNGRRVAVFGHEFVTEQNVNTMWLHPNDCYLTELRTGYKVSLEWIEKHQGDMEELFAAKPDVMEYEDYTGGRVE